VEFFIAACEDLGVPPHKLFRCVSRFTKLVADIAHKLRGHDLWNNASIVNVVECLCALAKIVEENYEVDVRLIDGSN
jgi:hypothetical protein